MKISAELKRALSELTDREKDKLVIRLIRKDTVLHQKLQFELVGNTTVEEERQLLETRIIQRLSSPRITSNFNAWMKEIRTLSGAINLHLKVTSDKIGEVSLSITLVTQLLEHNRKAIQLISANNEVKLAKYVTGKLFKIAVLISNLHEDLRNEFNAELTELHEVLLEFNYLLNHMKAANCDIDWFDQCYFPEDCNERVSKARKRGMI
jgi:hypothetical protein